MTSLAVEYWDTARLVPYAKNARLHDEAQVRQIAASMARFGFVNPILVDAQGEIVAGHGRALAAQLNGASTVPVIVLGHLTEEEVKAYRIADNRLAEIGGGWNMDLVRGDLSELLAGGFDIELTGFALDDIKEAKSGTDPDAVPDTPKVAVSQAGDMWLLGSHRLICGDSTSSADVTRLLEGARPNLMVTDPPYGVKYDPKWRDDLGIDWMAKGQKSTQRRSTHPNAKPISSRSLGKVSNDDKADWREAWALFPGNIAYVWHGGLHAATVQESLTATGFTVRAQIIWRKQHFVFSRGDYHWQHEPCWYAVRKTGRWTGDRKQTTIWDIANASAFHGDKDDMTTGHGTQKPVECMRRPIENNSKKGEVVYEPFSGSGTTVIAAEIMGRACYAVELDPAYVDVAVLRWQSFAGAEARLDGDGRTFAEVTEARRKKAARSSRAARGKSEAAA